jgi:hypothetical protein
MFFRQCVLDMKEFLMDFDFYKSLKNSPTGPFCPKIFLLSNKLIIQCELIS